MGKSWMNPNVGKCTREYILGCKKFLEYAWANRPTEFSDEIYCPCVRCLNNVLRPLNVVKKHLDEKGLLWTYVRWTKHGEPDEEVYTNHEPNIGDALHRMLQDAFPNMVNTDSEIPSEPSLGEVPTESCPDEPNGEAQKFFKLLKEADSPLYPGCAKSSKLSFLVRLFHIKCLTGWSNHSFDLLLEALKDLFPNETNMPKNHYESKKQLRDLGMECIKIDACPNDCMCMLYWKDNKRHEEKDECDVCGVSRWKPASLEQGTDCSTKTTKKKAAKVLLYFPLKPRLQRLFMCSETSKEMRWHDEGRTKDGALRHPANSKVWKNLDTKYSSFSLESRNVRLGLASDAFYPFGNMSTCHSTWPVVLIPYNLPPWMCMKQPYFILSLLIPGPSSPGNNIDVYHRPLVDELKELWTQGVETYDAHSKKIFKIHGALLWTMNDFLAYANLSGWSTKGALACPSCHEKTCSKRLRNGGKYCYIGSRQFVSLNHSFRRNKSCFDNNVEMRAALKPLSGSDVLAQLNGYNQITFSKSDNEQVRNKRKFDDILPHNWKKISIFFELPYWKDHSLRHNLDVMHIEKNNGESWLGTLLNIEGKTKENLKARQDLVLMGIRKSLHPIPKGENKYILPPGPYTLSLQEKRELCKFLKDVKVPDNYSANISRRVQVKECKLPGLKSHDWHVLIQQLLPVASRGILP